MLLPLPASFVFDAVENFFLGNIRAHDHIEAAQLQKQALTAFIDLGLDLSVKLSIEWSECTELPWARTMRSSIAQPNWLRRARWKWFQSEYVGSQLLSVTSATEMKTAWAFLQLLTGAGLFIYGTSWPFVSKDDACGQLNFRFLLQFYNSLQKQRANCVLPCDLITFTFWFATGIFTAENCKVEKGMWYD